MNILDQAAHVAASSWGIDKTYEQAMLERFYDVRSGEMFEKKAELAYWEQRAQAEQAEALDCTPDPEHDLHEETESDASDYWWSSRGV